MTKEDMVLILGEVVVDFTLPKRGEDGKLRLGGIVHAARGLWAAEQEYSVAAFCPQYLLEEAKRYLTEHGCKEFIWLGNIIGAPNVIVIGDQKEVSHQGYEDLLRECKQVVLCEPPPKLDSYSKAVIFPGKFDIGALLKRFSSNAKFSFDVAYDVNDLSVLHPFLGRIQAIITSTSSPLFNEIAKTSLNELLDEVRALSPEVFLLKENRGGSRLFDLTGDNIEEIPAVLGKTVNSVGVGDVYSAVMVSMSKNGWIEAAWRGAQAATVYSQTTYPDDMKRDLLRNFNLSIDELRGLGGTVLPWPDRQQFSIYLAGPDFSYIEKRELDQAVDSLRYHNFKVRRPILENGELERPTSKFDLFSAYDKDYQLLKECDAVFAIPLGRDPGTLVEVGMAIALNKPVITFDPRNENNNTMIVAGSHVYSTCLDECLNGTFNVLAKLRTASTWKKPFS
ncbi:nucleoside 2-deoxyribosyltransferase [Oxalobacter vibrioformis]|uniref:Nucleoside 2-deoxyribosyltransferase n=1 Tax=Oxalobacter vibrioformis TaxID=933080 RepID=A0A9E9M146_9BURK|nr:nucleoside 2-deoxyribosyltransferase [Oxalobacter vibrioformis]WAW11244.1 nucleoside 2-deoxyribosyltransferase [Oxalobacter vibrioformis]